MLKTNRKPWADMARGFAIVTVVFFHVAMGLAAVGQVDWKVWLLVNLFAPIPIALFFFVSGLFSRRIVDGRWSAGLGTRLIGLLYAFGVWSIIEGAVRFALTGTTPDRDVVRYLVDPASTLWFVWALAIFTLAAKLVWVRWPRLTVIGSIALSALSFADVLVVDSFVYENLLRFAPFFLVGLSAPWLEAAVSERRWSTLSIGGAGYLGLTALTAFVVPFSAAGVVLAAMAWVAIPASIAGCMVVGKLPVFGHVIRWLGQNSLGIYLGHPIAIMLLLAVTQRVWPVGEDPLFLPVFALTLPALFASAALFWLAVRSGATALYIPPLNLRHRPWSWVSMLRAGHRAPSIPATPKDG